MYMLKSRQKAHVFKYLVQSLGPSLYGVRRKVAAAEFYGFQG
jgi:hypothetical protein